jgi:hypothetical protein
MNSNPAQPCGKDWLLKLLVACLTLGLAPLPSAAEGPHAASLSARESNAAKAAELHARHTREFGANTNFLVRPGLLADRTTHRVVVYAESIRLGAGTFVEFPLIAENSGKDYEALAVSFAKPSAVHEALVFIGLPAGQGTDSSRMRFWPKGEHVRISFHYTETEKGKTQARNVPVEQLVLDERTGKTLPETGFVFTGSSWTSSPDSASTSRVYTADVFSPNCIISIYNEAGTVLDVPRRAAQHEVYSFQVINPDNPLPAAQFIEVVMERERKDGRSNLCELKLTVVPGPGLPPAPATSIGYVVNGPDAPSTTNTTVKELLRGFEKITGSGRESFVTVRPDDTLSLAALRTAATVVDSLENEHHVRIEPPPPGHPYYRTFLPDERHRERAGRPVQPWELHLGQNNGVVTGELVRLDEEWKGDDSQPTYREYHFAIASPAALNEKIRQKDTPSVMLVFAPADLSYGRLRQFIAPVIETRMILYVFLPPPAKPDTPGILP